MTNTSPEYKRVCRMCRGTKLESTPWLCVKTLEADAQDTDYDKGHYRTHPDFNCKRPLLYAIAILRDRPVFLGDTLYDELGRAYIVLHERNIVSGEIREVYGALKADISQRQDLSALHPFNTHDLA